MDRAREVKWMHMLPASHLATWKHTFSFLHHPVFWHLDTRRVKILEPGMMSSSSYVNIRPQRAKYHYAWWTICGIIEDVIWNSSWLPTYREVLPNLSQMSHLCVLICYSTVLIKRNILQLPRQSPQKWSRFAREAHTPSPPGQRKWIFTTSPQPRGGLASLAVLARMAWMVQIAYSVYVCIRSNSFH